MASLAALRDYEDDDDDTDQTESASEEKIQNFSHVEPSTSSKSLSLIVNSAPDVGMRVKFLLKIILKVFGLKCLQA